jgi:alkyl sulfatase BDS1-like metallo-beta-lactamase superfamily hydrolase
MDFNSTCVAAPTDGTGTAHTLHIDRAVWAAVLAGRRPLADVLVEGGVTVDGDPATFLDALTLFEVFQPVEHTPRRAGEAPR